MAGFKTLNETYRVGVARLHLLGSSGASSAWLGKSPEGVYKVVNGGFADANISVEELVNGVGAVAPEMPKGWTVEPITMTIRNPESPDAEKFRSDHGIDLKAERKEARKALQRNKKPKIFTPDELDKRQIIMAAAVVADWQNMPMSSDEKKLMPFTPENVMLFFKEHEVGLEQVKAFVADGKKFEDSTG